MPYCPASLELFSSSLCPFRFRASSDIKGLEADAIILIDLNKDSFFGYQGMLFYVGCSRAKKHLDFIASIPQTSYADIIAKLDPNAPLRKEPEKMRKVLGSVFSAEIQ